MSSHRLRADAAGITYAVALHADGAITVGEDAYSLEAIGPGAWRVVTGERAWIVHVAADEDGCWVHVDGAVHRVELAPAGARSRRRAGTGEHALSAPMPATVLAIPVTVGDVVRAGDTVLLLEAMKMELPVRAPRDGTVRALHCREGELVQPGVTLAEIA